MRNNIFNKSSSKSINFSALILFLIVAFFISLYFCIGIHLNTFATDDVSMLKISKKSLIIITDHAWRPIERVIYLLDAYCSFNLWFIVNLFSFIITALIAKKIIDYISYSPYNWLIILAILFSPLAIYSLFQSDHVSQNLCSMFTAALILCNLKKFYFSTAVIAVFSLLSKETSIGLVLFMPILMFFISDINLKKNIVSNYVPLIIYLLIRIFVLDGSYVEGSGRYSIEWLRAIPNIVMSVIAISSQIYPGELLAGNFRPQDILIGLSSITVIGILMYSIFLRRKEICIKKLSALFLLFIASTAPHFLGKISELYVIQSLVPFFLFISLLIRYAPMRVYKIIIVFIILGIYPLGERLLLIKNNSDDISRYYKLNIFELPLESTNYKTYSRYSEYVYPEDLANTALALMEYPQLRKGSY